MIFMSSFFFLLSLFAAVEFWLPRGERGPAREDARLTAAGSGRKFGSVFWRSWLTNPNGHSAGTANRLNPPPPSYPALFRGQIFSPRTAHRLRCMTLPLFAELLGHYRRRVSSGFWGTTV
jgi:hypothetical protein